MPPSSPSSPPPLSTVPDAVPPVVAAPGWRTERVDVTGSTNADLLAAFADPAAPVRPRLQALSAPLGWQEACLRFPPVVRRARRQSAGRGRLGRPWVSTPGNSLLFSLGVVMPCPLSALPGLSLAIGVAVLEGLRRLPLTQPSRLGLKWPNDILLDDAKLGGILIESAASAPHATALVIGIGVNLRGDVVLAPPATAVAGPAGAASALPPAVLASILPADAMAASDAAGTANVPHADGASDTLPEAALAGIVAALAMALERFAAQGLGPFRDRWWADHRFAGRAVSILDHGREQLRGIASGIDATGRLLIAPDAAAGARPGPLQAITAGDVSLRPVPDAPASDAFSSDASSSDASSPDASSPDTASPATPTPARDTRK